MNKVSARNVFAGEISKLTSGDINAEVELCLTGGDRLIAVLTEESLRTHDLAVGKKAQAYVKAPWVMLLAGGRPNDSISARNQLAGTVKSIRKSAINCEVIIELPGRTAIHALIPHEAVLELALQEGAQATALIKASHVMLGVPAQAG